MLMLQIIELPNHPYFIGVQFHPEFKSRPGKPSPLFLGTCLAHAKLSTQCCSVIYLSHEIHLMYTLISRALNFLVGILAVPILASNAFI
jgi:hypothetical protein